MENTIITVDFSRYTFEVEDVNFHYLKNLITRKLNSIDPEYMTIKVEDDKWVVKYLRFEILFYLHITLSLTPDNKNQIVVENIFTTDPSNATIMQNFCLIFEASLKNKVTRVTLLKSYLFSLTDSDIREKFSLDKIKAINSRFDSFEMIVKLNYLVSFIYILRTNPMISTSKGYPEVVFEILLKSIRNPHSAADIMDMITIFCSLMAGYTVYAKMIIETPLVITFLIYKLFSPILAIGEIKSLNSARNAALTFSKLKHELNPQHLNRIISIYNDNKITDPYIRLYVIDIVKFNQRNYRF